MGRDNSRDLSETEGASRQGPLETLRAKAEMMQKKVTLMSREIVKINQSFQNCITILTDWRLSASGSEGEALKNLIGRCKGCLESWRADVSEECVRSKEEITAATNNAVAVFTAVIQRLENVNSESGNDIRRKAADLVAIKNEMDLYDPSKRIHPQLRSGNKF
jgi:hypothetical protein